MLTGILLLAAGALGFAPAEYARLSWFCVFLAGLLMLINVHL